MFEIASGWKGKSPTAASIVPLMMFFRSHSAFRAAAALGTGRCSIEGMAGRRQCLEFAGYASLVNDDAIGALAQILVGTDEIKMAKVLRKCGAYSRIGAAQSAHCRISDIRNSPEIYDDLYDRVIQFGATIRLKRARLECLKPVMFRTGKKTVLLQTYLQGEGASA